MELLPSPTGEYLLSEASPDPNDEMAQWLSDIEFCKTELAFFTHLLNKAFLHVTVESKRQVLVTLEKKIAGFTKTELVALQKQWRHVEHGLATEVPAQLRPGERLKQDREKLRRAHQELGRKLKELKTEIFSVVAQQMKLEKSIRTGYESGELSL